MLKLGHEVRLVPPICVRPFVKRQENDAADTEAICEAAQRPTLRFVAVKTATRQAGGILFQTRGQRVRQRTRELNPPRGHLAEFGLVAPRGTSHVSRLEEVLKDQDRACPTRFAI